LRRAGSEKELWQQLRRERLVPLRNWSLPGLAIGGGGFALKDLAELNTQLNQLLSRGVPLVEALEVAASAVSGASRAKVEKIREMVASGVGFADACRTVGGFDPVTVAVYRAAERTGDLAGAAKQLAATIRRQLAISGKAVTLLIYPAIVLTISFGVTLYLLTNVVPKVGAALKNANVPMPAVTSLMITVGDFLRENWMMVGLGALGVAAVAVFLREQIVRFVWVVARKLPLIKDVLLLQETVRFFSVMAAMTRGGVTLADSLGTATQAVNDPTLKGELRTLRTRLIEGGVLRNLIEDVRALPLATRKLLIAGERAGDLESVFENLAADMTDELERRSSRALVAMEPVLLVMMFVMIGSLVMAIMLPLIDLGAGIGG
jgi:type II secretory pathway component PulF